MHQRFIKSIPFVLFTLHIVFALFAYFVFGVRVYTDSRLNWDWMWQNIPMRLLKENPVESLWHLHSVPPLPNALMALLARVSDHPVEVLHFVHIVMGALIPPMIFRILIDQGARLAIALTAALFVVIDPGLILFEAYFLYDIPTALILVASCYFLSRYCVSQKRGYLISFIAALVTGALVRSAIHIGFIMICIAGALYLAREWRRTFAVAALLCTMPLALWIGKNAILFGVSGTSSWMGLSMWKMASGQDGEIISRLVDTGAIPAHIVELGRYPLPDQFGPYGYSTSSTVEILSLNNYNNIGIIEYSRHSGLAAMEVLKASPAHYFKSVLNSYYQFCRPTAHSTIVEGNAATIKNYVNAHTHWISGTILWPGKESNQLTWYWFGFPLFLVLNCIRYLLLFRKKINFDLLNREATMIYLLMVIYYIITVSCLIEGSEGDRYKIYIEHLFWVLVILTLQPTRWKTLAVKVKD